MKVVLFCGGASLRLPDVAEAVPKPMITIGYRPVLWHVMRCYAHLGMRDFVLCLGQRGDLIKDYFLHYDEALSNDFVLSDSGRQVELLGHDIADWRISFVDTGQSTEVGERLLRVRDHVAGEAVFAANYADVVTDAPLDELAADFASRTEVAALVAVRPSHSFHLVDEDGQGASPACGTCAAPTCGSTAGTTCSGRPSSTTSGRATTSSTGPSSASSPTASWWPTATTASTRRSTR